jgi:hypothetical protein
MYDFGTNALASLPCAGHELTAVTSAVTAWCVRATGYLVAHTGV